MNLSKISIFFFTLMVACHSLPLLDIAEDDLGLATTESLIITTEGTLEAEASTGSTATTIEPEEEHSEAPVAPSTTTTEQPLDGHNVAGEITVSGGFEFGVPETDLCYWEGDLWVCLPSSQPMIIVQNLLP